MVENSYYCTRDNDSMPVYRVWTLLLLQILSYRNGLVYSELKTAIVSATVKHRRSSVSVCPHCILSKADAIHAKLIQLETKCAKNSDHVTTYEAKFEVSASTFGFAISQHSCELYAK